MERNSTRPPDPGEPPAWSLAPGTAPGWPAASATQRCDPPRAPPCCSHGYGAPAPAAGPAAPGVDLLDEALAAERARAARRGAPDPLAASGVQFKEVSAGPGVWDLRAGACIPAPRAPHACRAPAQLDPRCAAMLLSPVSALRAPQAPAQHGRPASDRDRACTRPPAPPATAPAQIRADSIRASDAGARAAADSARTALGAGYEARLRREAGPDPSKLARRKHQIGSLYHSAKLQELEALEKVGGAAEGGFRPCRVPACTCNNIGNPGGGCLPAWSGDAPVTTNAPATPSTHARPTPSACAAAHLGHEEQGRDAAQVWLVGQRLWSTGAVWRWCRPAWLEGSLMYSGGLLAAGRRSKALGGSVRAGPLSLVKLGCRLWSL
jgi:hypothetical protein